MEEMTMEWKRVWSTVCVAAVAGAVLYLGQAARATQASGFTSSSLITTFTPTFAEFEVFNHLKHKELEQLAPTYPDRTWTAIEKTRGPSDLYIQTNTWAVGGSTGWHRHPGHSLIVITSGTVVQYHADCVPEVYGPGTANGPTFVDSGDDEHLVRNEDGKGATGYAVQIVAHGAPRRIDEPLAPDTCQIY
jgi:hypothetical protein